MLDISLILNKKKTIKNSDLKVSKKIAHKETKNSDITEGGREMYFNEINLVSEQEANSNVFELIKIMD